MKIFLFFLLFSCSGLCQKNSLFDFTKIQRGPYFGFQQGRNIVLELGFEKRIKDLVY